MMSIFTKVFFMICVFAGIVLIGCGGSKKIAADSQSQINQIDDGSEKAVYLAPSGAILSPSEASREPGGILAPGGIGQRTERLSLTLLITDTYVTIGVKNGFMPSIFYIESPDDNELYVIDPDCAFENVNANTGIDSCDIVNTPENCPLSLFDELKTRLLQVKERYGHEVSDSRDITIATERQLTPERLEMFRSVARSAGFPNIANTLIDNLERPRNADDNVPTMARSHSSIRDVVVRESVDLRKAYIKRNRERPGLRGMIYVKFAVNEHGKVIFAKVESSTMNDPEFEQTVISKIREWEFGAINKPDDVSEIIFPFNFEE